MFDFFWPHGLQPERLLCPLQCPGGCSNSCPLSQWCYLTISSSSALFSFCLHSLPSLVHVCVPCGMGSSLVGADVTHPFPTLCNEPGGPDAGRLQWLSHLFLLLPFPLCRYMTPVLWEPEHRVPWSTRLEPSTRNKFVLVMPKVCLCGHHLLHIRSMSSMCEQSHTHMALLGKW